MKLVKWLMGLVALLCIGGFAYFGITDIPIDQQDISLDIPHEQLAEE